MSLKDYLNSQPIWEYFNRYIAPSNPRLGYFSSAGGKIVCPFHDDLNPSLGIIPGTNIFHCFGCKAHGTLIEFHQRLRSLPPNPKCSESLAVQELAALYPMSSDQLTLTSPTSSPNIPTYSSRSYARDVRTSLSGINPWENLNSRLADLLTYQVNLETNRKEIS